MALKFFLIYVGSLLVCSIIFALTTKNFAVGFVGKGKKPYVYGIISSVLVSSVAFLLTFLTDNLFTVFWYLGSLFLVFGIIDLTYARKKYFYSYKNKDDTVIVARLLFGFSIILFTIGIFSLLMYFLKHNRTFLFYPMVMSSLLFFVPIFLYHTFEAATGIPSAHFNTWQYPLKQLIEYIPNKKERVLVICFQISKKVSSQKKSSIRAKAPEHMKFGEMFYHFLNDYNIERSETKIEYADDKFEAHEWWFYKKTKWFQPKRILDPDLSVRENGIAENTVIVCERIQGLIQEYNYHERSA